MKIRNGKKYLALILAGAVAVSMAACSSGGSNDEADETGTMETEETAGADATENDQTSAISQLEEFDPTEFVTEATYKGVELDVQDPALTDEEFETRLESFLNSYSEAEQITNRVTEEGDVIVADYSGSVDGVAFNGGTATNQIITVGASGFIEDLDQALIGAPCGEEFVVDATFPESYGNSELAGVEAQFTVLIHYIEGDRIVPELTDEFVQSLEDYDCSTAEEFKEVYRQELADLKAESYEYQNMNNLWTQILNETTFNGYPENYVEAYYSDMIDSYNYYASVYGLELEDYVSYYGLEMEEFYSLLQNNAELQVKSEIMYRYIAQAENIVATEEEYLAMVQEYMDTYGYTDMAAFVNDFGADVVENQGYADATLRKVMTFCYENAVLNVVSAEEAAETTAAVQ